MHGTFLEVRAVYRVANQAVASEYRRTVRQLHAPDEGKVVRFRLALNLSALRLRDLFSAQTLSDPRLLGGL